MLGVRPTNASAFCKWLTARENGPWRYRLPKEGEFQQEVQKGLLDGFGTGLGYWLDEGKGFVRVKEVAPAEAKALWDYVDAALDRASTSASATTHASDLDRVIASDSPAPSTTP